MGRDPIPRRLGLPERMSTKAMLEVLCVLYTPAELAAEAEGLETERPDA